MPRLPEIPPAVIAEHPNSSTQNHPAMAPAADDHSLYRIVGNNPFHGENPGGLEDDPGQQKLFREITERLEDWIWYGRIMHLNVWRMLCRCTVLPAMAMKPTEKTGCSLFAAVYRRVWGLENAENAGQPGQQHAYRTDPGLTRSGAHWYELANERNEWKSQHTKIQTGHDDALAVSASLRDIERGQRGVPVEDVIANLKTRYCHPTETITRGIFARPRTGLLRIRGPGQSLAFDQPANGGSEDSGGRGWDGETV